MNNYQQLVLNKNRPKIPKDVRKLMGPKGSISEVREKLLQRTLDPIVFLGEILPYVFGV